MPEARRRKAEKKAVRAPRQRRSKATVEAILDAAARILSDEGWAAFNTNAIAVRAGVSIGTLYEYFGNKHAVLEAVAGRHLEAAEQAVARSAVAEPSTTRTSDVIDRLVEGYVALHQEDPALHRVLSTEAPLTPALRRRKRELEENVVDLVARALAGRVPEPKLSADVIVATADALTHRWIVEEDGAPLPAERLTRELKTMLCAYLSGLER